MIKKPRFSHREKKKKKVLFVLNVLNVNEWKVLLQVPDDDFALKIFEESRSRCAQFLIDSRHAHVTRRMRLTIIGNPTTGKATLYNRLVELLGLSLSFFLSVFMVNERKTENEKTRQRQRCKVIFIVFSSNKRQGIFD